MNRIQRTAAVALALVITGFGCAQKPSVAPPEKVTPLTFIENDFPRALALARESNLPLFVEVWAPW